MTTKRKYWSDALKQYNPCADALAWARTQPSAAVAWRDCTRGDWMLWLVGQLSGPPESASRKALVLAACACARLALPHVPASEERPRIAIETAEQWARGENGVMLDNVKRAAHAAAYAGENTAAYAAYAAAHAAVYAAYAAVYAYAAAYAADAAYAVAYAAYVGGGIGDDYTKKRTLSQGADIIRKHYPKPPRLA